MKKLFKTVILMLLTLSLSACAKPDSDDGGSAPGDGFRMTAKIEAIDEKITVDVIEAEYAEGVYLVITSDATDFLDKNGKKIKKSDLRVGDTVEIAFGGQVMMSYPPQIVAASIKVI